MIFKLGIINYENFTQFLKTHVGGDDKLWINLAWPYSSTSIYYILWSADHYFGKPLWNTRLDIPKCFIIMVFQCKQKVLKAKFLEREPSLLWWKQQHCIKSEVHPWGHTSTDGGRYSLKSGCDKEQHIFVSMLLKWFIYTCWNDDVSIPKPLDPIIKCGSFRTCRTIFKTDVKQNK